MAMGCAWRGDRSCLTSRCCTRRIGGVPVNGPAHDDAEELPGSEPMEIANEYARVQVRRVKARNGSRMEIVAPHLGRGIRLCPLELETLTWQTHDTFSDFLATPFEPEWEPDR
jgi:hypothetical protein